MPLPEDNAMEMTGFGDIAALGDFLRLRDRFERIRELYASSPMPRDEIPEPTLFFMEGDPICRIESPPPGAAVSQGGVPLPCDRATVEVVRDGASLVYRAKLPGYLGWDDGLRLFPPLIKLSDYLIVFRNLPILCGRELLAAYAARACRSHRQRFFNPEITILSPGQAELLADGDAGDTVIIEGVEARPGRDAEVRVLAAERVPHPSDDEGVDYREFRHYIVARQGDVLAEKLEAFPGTEGVTVNGDRVAVYPGKDIPFSAGENVIAEPAGEKTLFRAAIDGLVHLDGTSVSVSEMMMIGKDVDLKTGNIDYSKDVVIKGSVRGGFSLSAGGCVLIGGAVEPGADIRVKGDLTVAGGVLGSSTFIRVDGNADIGFVQDARVYCEGSLRIRKHVINGQIFAGHDLRVDGKGVKEKGQAVQGGVCTAMRELDVHSAGSPFTDTVLTAGYNAYAEASLNTIDEAIVALDLQIHKLMTRIGVDSDIGSCRERILAMPPGQRARLKAALIEIKEYSVKREQLLAEREKRRLSVYQSDSSVMRISVRRRLVPKVVVKMIDQSHVFNQPAEGINLRYYEDHIVRQ